MVEPHDAVAPQQPALQVEEKSWTDLYPVMRLKDTTQNNNESLVQNEPYIRLQKLQQTCGQAGLKKGYKKTK